MQYDGGGGGTVITLNTMNNGVFDAVEIYPNRAERQQRAQRDGLLTAAALVQALRWEDVEGPVIKDQGVGFCPVRLGVVAEDIQVRLPLQLPVVPEVWVPGPCRPDTEDNAGRLLLLPRLEVGGTLDLYPHFLSRLPLAHPSERERDIIGPPVHFGAGQVKVQGSGNNELAEGPSLGVHEEIGGVPGPVVPKEVAYRHPVKPYMLISGPLLPHDYPPLFLKSMWMTLQPAAITPLWLFPHPG